MALEDKAALFAERLSSVPKAIENVIDVQMARLDGLLTRGAESGKRMTKFVDSVETAVTTTEAVLNKLDNGGPPLSDTAASLPQPSLKG